MLKLFTATLASRFTERNAWDVTPDGRRFLINSIGNQATQAARQVASITEALEGLTNGRVVSHIADGQKRFDVVMRLSDASRSTSGLGDILMSTPTGMIPLRLVE